MSALSSRAPQGLPSLDVELKISNQLLSHDGNGVTPTRKSPHTPMTPGEFRERAGRLLSLKNPHATTGKGLAAAVAYAFSSCRYGNKCTLSPYHHTMSTSAIVRHIWTSEKGGITFSIPSSHCPLPIQVAQYEEGAVNQTWMHTSVLDDFSRARPIVYWHQYVTN